MTSVGKRCAQKCGNLSYDIFTILISIADVATDIIVLINFYNEERWTFFALSLTILILAQCSYSIAFAFRFDTIDDWPLWAACTLFCCCLPFGSFVAFCIYFASDESDCGWFKNFIKHGLGLTSEGFFKVKQHDSNFTKWIKSKLDKHLGFILEAGIEAFPQSMIQIAAIVYYQEANYISIISILLSMFSVMTKSFILSQGLEKYTFSWTWLCVVTDFFGIFFTLTWVFYSNELIHGNFLGYFNIFGQIWIIKVCISTLLPIGLALCAFFSFGLWFMFCVILFAPNFSSRHAERRLGYSCLWLTFTPIIAILGSFVVCLFAEVFCFGLLAIFVYMLSTNRIRNLHQERVKVVLSSVLDFISNGNYKDRLVRVMAVNTGFNKIHSSYHCDAMLQTFINVTANNGKYKALQKVTYKDLRARCQWPSSANLFKHVIGEVLQENDENVRHFGRAYGMDAFFAFVVMVGFFLIAFIVFPILLLSKILQILFPWIIIGYLGYYNLLFTNAINQFQMVMLWIYVSLQLMLCVLGVYVFRIHWWIWHIHPGRRAIQWYQIDERQLMREVQGFYDEMCWYPQITEMMMMWFGKDIGAIIMDYCENFELEEP